MDAVHIKTPRTKKTKVILFEEPNYLHFLIRDIQKELIYYLPEQSDISLLLPFVPQTALPDFLQRFEQCRKRWICGFPTVVGAKYIFYGNHLKIYIEYKGSIGYAGRVLNGSEDQCVREHILKNNLCEKCPREIRGVNIKYRGVVIRLRFTSLHLCLQITTEMRHIESMYQRRGISVDEGPTTWAYSPTVSMKLKQFKENKAIVYDRLQELFDFLDLVDDRKRWKDMFGAVLFREIIYTLAKTFPEAFFRGSSLEFECLSRKRVVITNK